MDEYKKYRKHIKKNNRQIIQLFFIRKIYYYLHKNLIRFFLRY